MSSSSNDLPSDSLQSIPDNIAVSYLPDSESLSKKSPEKGLHYFSQGYIYDIKISTLEDRKLGWMQNALDL